MWRKRLENDTSGKPRRVHVILYMRRWHKNEREREAEAGRRRARSFPFIFDDQLQGDRSPWRKPPVDLKTKVPFWYEAHLLKHNLCLGVNGRFCAKVNGHPVY